MPSMAEVRYRCLLPPPFVSLSAWLSTKSLGKTTNWQSSVYEAASIDGATGFQKFRYMTLPLLKPIILFTTINSTIGTLQLFDETMNITQGGPANATITISQYIYNLLFKYQPNFGYAAAVSYVIVVLIVVLSFIQLKVGDKNE